MMAETETPLALITSAVRNVAWAITALAEALFHSDERNQLIGALEKYLDGWEW